MHDDLWFNYDGMNFLHKINPYSDTVAPKSKIWRQRAEGLKLSRKGNKEGNGGKKVKLFVAISYGKGGVIVCEEYPRDKRYIGVNYRQFVLDKVS